MAMCDNNVAHKITVADVKTMPFNKVLELYYQIVQWLWEDTDLWILELNCDIEDTGGDPELISEYRLVADESAFDENTGSRGIENRDFVRETVVRWFTMLEDTDVFDDVAESTFSQYGLERVPEDPAEFAPTIVAEYVLAETMPCWVPGVMLAFDVPAGGITDCYQRVFVDGQDEDLSVYGCDDLGFDRW